MDLDEIARKKQKLIKQMNESGKERNPSEDHAIGLKTLQNPKRRMIMEFLVDGTKSLEEIKIELDMSDMQAKLNLDMLEDAFYISKIDPSDKTEYELTIRGEAYLENVKTGVKK
ncbi:hypothetical protein LI82_00450 [Methanococcoides methylutens]|uniref:ArsR family transcriptional regulator n=2 Tax=Methanococcoides methylutens TaxID=2226 RepID=A0A099T3F9_METMT|nr:hypothetical protein LI82_00450 [Methanococcoides methylutens]